MGLNIVTGAWREKMENDSLVSWCNDEGCQMKWQGASCETSEKCCFTGSTKHSGKLAEENSFKHKKPETLLLEIFGPTTCEKPRENLGEECCSKFCLFLWYYLVTRLNIFVFEIRQDLNWWPSCAWWCQSYWARWNTCLAHYGCSYCCGIV